MRILRRPRSLRGFLVHAAEIHERREQAFAEELAAQKDVGRDVEVVGEREVLVDGLDAERLGVARLLDRDRSSVDSDLALVGRRGAGERLDEARLAGGVVAHQRVDLAGVDGEVRPRERLDAAVALLQPAQLDERLWSHSFFCEPITLFQSGVGFCSTGIAQGWEFAFSTITTGSAISFGNFSPRRCRIAAAVAR